MQAFSVIIPAYNEEEILASNLSRLNQYCEKLNANYELIVVSNGSTDKTNSIGKELEKSHSKVKFFSLPEKGVGRAFKKGIQEAKYEHIVFMDADLSAELVFIEKANLLLDKNVIVLGTKLNGLQNRSLFRKMGSFVFFLSVKILLGMGYIDYAPGAKAFQKSFLVKNVQHIDDFTSFVLNLTYIAHIHKEPIAEISIACDDRRKSRFNLWKEAGSKFGGLLRLKWRGFKGR